MAEVRINEYGFAFVRVFLRCNDSPEVKRVRYKVDTGANCNTIGRDWLHACGYGDDWIKETGKLLVGKERPSVATNKPVDQCYEIVLPEIRLGTWTGYNWPFLVSLDKDTQFRELFGTDSLQFFNWEFLYSQAICRFEAINGKQRKLASQKVQSIHSVDEMSTCTST